MSGIARSVRMHESGTTKGVTVDNDVTGPPDGPPSFPTSVAPPPPPGSMPPPMPPPPGLGAFPPPPTGAFPPPGPFVTPGTPVSSSGLPLAHWGIRLGGYAIDLVLSAIVQRIFESVFRHTSTLQVHWIMHRPNRLPMRYSLSFLAIIVSLLIFVVYATLMIGTRGQTLGMMAVGIRAVRAEDDGSVGLGRALGRALIQLVMALTVIVGLISDFFPLWDPKRQTLQDKAASTLVVRSRGVR